MSREAKVGALVVAALAAFAVTIFLVGERNNLFVRKIEYFIRFENVGGLAAGNPVQLSGVTVGKVERIDLPEAVDKKRLTVWISIAGNYGQRIREDSVARIKTLGLLGDKYIEISSGSPASPVVEATGEISAAAPTDVDRLLASGEDAVDNVVAISYSLRGILDRVNAGEGLLGELLMASESGERVKESVIGTLSNVEVISSRLSEGKGSLGQLLIDDTLATELADSVARLNRVLEEVESGEGALAALLRDPATRSELTDAVSSLKSAADGANRVVARFDDGEGLLQRFLSDQAFADEVTNDLAKLLENLNSITEKLDRGHGALGKVIGEPELYDAMNDIVIGINESKLLRWLIRNRQKAGIEKRFEDEGGGDPSELPEVADPTNP